MEITKERCEAGIGVGVGLMSLGFLAGRRVVILGAILAAGSAIYRQKIEEPFVPIPYPDMREETVETFPRTWKQLSFEDQKRAFNESLGLLNPLDLDWVVRQIDERHLVVLEGKGPISVQKVKNQLGKLGRFDLLAKIKGGRSPRRARRSPTQYRKSPSKFPRE